MNKQKINLTIGRFQPFTKGHENMVNEGDVPCIIYQLSSADAEIQTTRNGIKIGSKSYKKDIVKSVVDFLNGEDVELALDSTIEEYKRKRFESIKPEWLTSHVDEIFNRWFNKDKSFKATELKKLYPEHYDEVKSDKFAKDFIGQVMKPLDNLFLSIGNELIDLLDGFTNKNSHNETIEILKKDLESTVELVNKSNSQELKDKVLIQLERLHNLNDKYNSAEGIVFTYKGKRMKLTGSFACINSILGSRFSL